MSWVRERAYDFIGRQLGNPTGWFGRRVMTALLDRGNAEQIDGTLAEVGLRADDRYLDVGFGGGRSLARAARVVRDGRLYGVDRSPDVVAAGRRRLRRLVEAGRLTLLVGDVADLPLRDGEVTRVTTVNTIYFWSDPPAAMRSIARVLAPGGALAIGFTGAAKMRRFARITRRGFTHYEPDQVVELAADAGLDDIQVIPLRGRLSTGDYVVRARRR